MAQVKRLHIRSIAISSLGCGNGGLEWRDALIVNAFAELPDVVEVRLFGPDGAPYVKKEIKGAMLELRSVEKHTRRQGYARCICPYKIKMPSSNYFLKRKRTNQ